MESSRIFSSFHSQVHSQKKTAPKSQQTPSDKLESSKKDDSKFIEKGPQKDLSDREIRAKIHSNKEAGKKDKVEVSKEAKKKDNSQESKESEKKAENIPESDISLNEPNDPQTQEKLKKALQNGTFSFSGKEKHVLSKILMDSEN